MGGYLDSQGSAFVNPVAVAGLVTPATGNASHTTANTDYSFGWQDGLGNAIAVDHVYVENNTSANLQWELDATATAGSPVIAPGDAKLFDIRTTVLHLLTAANQNVNGSSGGNIIVRSWQ